MTPEEKEWKVPILMSDNTPFKHQLEVKPASARVVKGQAMTAEQLEALSKAATQGEWGIWRESISSRHDAIAELKEQVEATDPVNDALVLLDAGGKCPAITGCGPTSDANAAFITTLVNLYRQGQFILVDDAAEVSFVLEWTAAPRPPVHPKPMAGRQVFSTMEKALTFFSKQPADATFGTLREVRKHTVDRTTAAIAAMGGK